MQVHVVPVEKGGMAGADGGGSGDAIDGEEPPRKRAKVMLLQVMRKGMYMWAHYLISCCETHITKCYFEATMQINFVVR